MYILLIAKHLGVILKRYFLVYLGMFVRGREMREQDQASMLQSGKNLEESRLNFSTCTSLVLKFKQDTVKGYSDCSASSGVFYII